jgi:Arc/MetJ family transcription regulator
VARFNTFGGNVVTTTQINLDDASLAEAADVLGTKTKVETVNTALRAVVRQHRQRQMLERAAQDGTYSETPSDDDAWR